MQTFRSVPVHLLLAFVCLKSVLAAPIKTHIVSLGSTRTVPYIPPDAATKSDQPATLKIRALIVDGKQKEWTTGDTHDVTERSYVVRRVLKLNDALPGEKERWVWQPGPWLLVDRNTGHVAALHLPDFDSIVSEVVWYRDYAAYCGVSTTTRGGLYAVVAQLAVRKAIVSKKLGPWPQPEHPSPICAPAQWQRDPMRITFTPTGAPPATYDVVGTASALVEAGDDEE